VPSLQENLNHLSQLLGKQDSPEESLLAELVSSLEELSGLLHLSNANQSAVLLNALRQYLKAGHSNNQEWSSDWEAISGALKEMAAKDEPEQPISLPYGLMHRLLTDHCEENDWSVYLDVINVLVDIEQQIESLGQQVDDSAESDPNAFLKCLQSLKASATLHDVTPVASLLAKVMAYTESTFPSGDDHSPEFQQLKEAYLQALHAGLAAVRDAGIDEDSVDLLTQKMDENLSDYQLESEEDAGEEDQVQKPQYVPGPTETANFTRAFGEEVQQSIQQCNLMIKTLRSSLNDKKLTSQLLEEFYKIQGLASWYDQGDIANLTHNTSLILDRVVNKSFDLDEETLELVRAGVYSIVVIVNERQAKLEGIEPQKPDFETFDQIDEPEQANPSPAPETQLNAQPEKPAEPSPAPVAAKTEEKSKPKTASEKPKAPKADPSRGKPASKLQVAESVKVDRLRLDQLINLIGELVIAESMVHQEISSNSSIDLNKSSKVNQLNKITRELQELSLSLRMVPIQGTFQKMNRLVRDLAKKLDKPVKMAMEGAETELDRALANCRGCAVVLVYHHGNMRELIHRRFHHRAQERSPRVLSGAGTGLHDHRRVGGVGSFHNGAGLFQVIDVKGRDAVVVLGGVVQHLSHTDQWHG